VVPADDKKNARLIISQIIVDTLGNLKMTYPRPGNLKKIRKNLSKSRIS
jgi:hypothetical protein